MKDEEESFKRELCSGTKIYELVQYVQNEVSAAEYDVTTAHYQPEQSRWEFLPPDATPVII